MHTHQQFDVATVFCVFFCCIYLFLSFFSYLTHYYSWHMFVIRHQLFQLRLNVILFILAYAPIYIYKLTYTHVHTWQGAPKQQVYARAHLPTHIHIYVLYKCKRYAANVYVRVLTGVVLSEIRLYDYKLCTLYTLLHIKIKIMIINFYMHFCW